jgi:hypothetical protein
MLDTKRQEKLESTYYRQEIPIPNLRQLAIHLPDKVLV